ncbi:MAG: NACHT domain-containing protein [Clostridia bacterium]|nr:NACHT domain-containing protein [Clostridia bacterium]
MNEVGRGSNAIVYRGRYADTFHQTLNHYVLIKELFPLHPANEIYRASDGSIICTAEGKALWDIHRQSFETGNRAHLSLMEASPDQIGSNLNTYGLNGTLYTVMGLSGGRSLESLASGEAQSLRLQTERMLNILDALEVFHQNGLLHLDVAPDNILISRSGSQERVTLIDFNSCAAVGPNGMHASAAASVKQGYTAPEIRSGWLNQVGVPADLYSATAVFFRLITGAPLTPFQMIRNQPPDVNQCQCMRQMPETVRSLTAQILRRGLYSLPQKRYQSAEEMRNDLRELLNRIDGVGITYSALWEVGHRNAQRMVRQNASLAYMSKTEDLYPLRVQWYNNEESEAFRLGGPRREARRALWYNKDERTGEAVARVGGSRRERRRPSWYNNERTGPKGTVARLGGPRMGARRALLQNGGAVVSAQEFTLEVLHRREHAVLLLGAGGMGKSTLLMRMALEASSRYRPTEPAMLYVPLSSWKQNETSFLLDHILQDMKFDLSTRTMEDARHALTDLLAGGGGKKGTLMLLLDGMNEASGDISALVEEINRLSALPGLRVLVTSRSVPEKLKAEQAALVPLAPQDVSGALAKNGLLLPEKPEMQRLLQTPMMLSMFIQTAQAQNGQVLCGTEQELLESYFQSLGGKTEKDGEAARYQADMAIQLILPRIANRMKRHPAGMDDRALMENVLPCRVLLRSRVLATAFPQWIGHGGELSGGKAMSNDAWYAQIVQQLLWKRLGLLLRDGAGRYHMPHQILQEYLCGKARENQRRILLARYRRIALAAAVLLLAAACSLAVYEIALKPEPPHYFEVEYSNVLLEGIWPAYKQCETQREALKNLLEGIILTAECKKKVADNADLPAARTMFATILKMSETPQWVVAGSGNTIDFEHCMALLNLPKEQGEAYQVYIDGYELLRGGSENDSLKDYCEALENLLTLDQEAAELLCKLVWVPHMALEEQNERWVNIRSGMDRSEKLEWKELFIGQKGNLKELLEMLSAELEETNAARKAAQDGLAARFPFLEQCMKKE